MRNRDHQYITPAQIDPIHVALARHVTDLERVRRHHARHRRRGGPRAVAVAGERGERRDGAHPQGIEELLEPGQRRMAQQILEQLML